MSFTYQSKPKQVEAFRIIPDAQMQETNIIPKWFLQGVIKGILSEENGKLIVTTNTGPAEVSEGDWIIYSRGEMYPCSDEDFHKNYEACPECQ